MTNLYRWQYEILKQGKCYVCDGTGKRTAHDEDHNYVEVPCEKCGQSGKPTPDDLHRSRLYENRVCAICDLPMVGDENPGTKYERTRTNDCLDHLRQYVQELEKRLERLESAHLETL